jgi:hypothetical protein
MANTYYFLAASAAFFKEHIVCEILEERSSNYKSKNKAIDFWHIEEPRFLELTQFNDLRRRCPQPAAAIVSTDGQFILWLKHRLQYVASGQFDPSAVADPLAGAAVVY